MKDVKVRLTIRYNKIFWERKRERSHSLNFHYGMLLQLFYFIFSIVISLLLFLIYKLRFIIGVYV